MFNRLGFFYIMENDAAIYVWTSRRSETEINDYYLSPTFFSEALDNTKWRITLYYPKEGKEMCGHLSRCGNDDGPEIIMVNFNVNAIKSNGSLFPIVSVKNIQFQKDGKHRFKKIFQMTELFDCMELKFRCDLWKSNVGTSAAAETSSRILMNTISRIWDHKWNPDASISSSLGEATNELELKKFWTLEINSSDLRCISQTGYLIQVDCGLSILDDLGKSVIRSEKKTFNFRHKTNAIGNTIRNILESKAFKMHSLFPKDSLKIGNCDNTSDVTKWVGIASKETQTSHKTCFSKETQTTLECSASKETEMNGLSSNIQIPIHTLSLSGSGITIKESPFNQTETSESEECLKKLHFIISASNDDKTEYNDSDDDNEIHTQDVTHSTSEEETSREIRDSKEYQFSVNELVSSKSSNTTAAEKVNEFSLENEIFCEYRSGCHSDITVCSGEQEWPAHSVILSMRSSVLCDMLNSEMHDSRSRILQLNDVDTETVDAMITFLYFDTLPEDLLLERVAKLYSAAHKFQIVPLIALCSGILTCNISLLNVCYMCALANIHQDWELKVCARNFICNNAKDVFDSDEWIAFMKENVELAAELMHHVLLEKIVK